MTSRNYDFHRLDLQPNWTQGMNENDWRHKWEEWSHANKQFTTFFDFDPALLAPLCRGGCTIGVGSAEWKMPENQQFRERISEQEFDEFRTELKEKMYQATPYCILPGIILGLPLMFLCFLQTQLFIWRPSVNCQSACWEVIARYNKFLFKPRGIQATLEASPLQLPSGSSEHSSNNNSSNNTWRINFYVAEEPSVAAIEAICPPQVKADEAIQPCPGLFSCTPKVQYHSDEGVVEDAALETKYRSANENMRRYIELIAENVYM